MMKTTLSEVLKMVQAIDPKATCIEEIGGGYVTICSDHVPQVAGDLTKRYDNVVGFSATQVVVRIV